VSPSTRPGAAKIARDLGIYEGTLGSRVNRAKASGRYKDKPLDISERARLKELEDENRRLRLERDFLKSCGARFAKENQ